MAVIMVESIQLDYPVAYGWMQQKKTGMSDERARDAARMAPTVAQATAHEEKVRQQVDKNVYLIICE